MKNNENWWILPTYLRVTWRTYHLKFLIERLHLKVKWLKKDHAEKIDRHKNLTHHFIPRQRFFTYFCWTRRRFPRKDPVLNIKGINHKQFPNFSHTQFTPKLKHHNLVARDFTALQAACFYIEISLALWEILLLMLWLVEIINLLFTTLSWNV